MKCPFCNQDNTRVVDSRPVEDTNSIRRRRLCDACGRRFTTYEKVESIPLTVIKKDQNREQYSRAKIQAGILRACYKRPISIDKVEEMMDVIQDTLNEVKVLFNNAPDLKVAIRKYIDENAGLKKQMEDYMKEKSIAIKERLLENAKNINGIRLITMNNMPIPADVVKNIAFQLRGEITENMLFVAGTVDNEKPLLTVMASDNLVKDGINAGQIVREAAKLIQGGGGQPHFATAGGKNTDGLNAAIEKVIELAGLK